MYVHQLVESAGIIFHDMWVFYMKSITPVQDAAPRSRAYN